LWDRLAKLRDHLVKFLKYGYTEIKKFKEAGII